MEEANVLKVIERKSWDLKLNFCGYAKTHPLHSFGPAVRPHYLIHYVLSGEGYYYIGNQQYHIRPGQGFLIEPDVLTFYQAHGTNPWEYVWIGFSGEMAIDVLYKIGLNAEVPVFTHENRQEIKELIDSMMACNTMSVSDELKRNGLLYLLFSCLSENRSAIRLDDRNNNVYIQKAVEFIKNNYHTNIKVSDIADYVCLNRSYLYTLFTQNLSMTPQEYLNTFRLTKACELLGLTEYPVGSIAVSCGYSDPVVFSKSFRKSFGKTPSQYRQDIR